MLDKVYAPLSGTSNSSAPGLEGINYKRLKLANKISLREQLMVQVATNLPIGIIPRECQDSRVVFFPKPGKEQTQPKDWRTITLIKCIGKVGE